MQTGDFKQAQEEFETLIEQRPEDANAHYWLGAAAGSLAANVSLFKAAGYARTVKKSFERAIELDPRHIEAHEGLVSFYLQAPRVAGGSKKKAAVIAQQLASFAPVQGGLVLAQIAQDAGDTQDALAMLEQVSKQAGDDPRPMLRAGYIYQEAKDYAQAHAAFARASTVTPATPAAESDRLAALYQIGRTAVFSKQRIDAGIEALIAYENQAGAPRGNQPSVAWARYRRGLLHQLAGDNEAAREAFVTAQASAVDPDLIAILKRALRSTG